MHCGTVGRGGTGTACVQQTITSESTADGESGWLVEDETKEQGQSKFVAIHQSDLDDRYLLHISRVNVRPQSSQVRD